MNKFKAFYYVFYKSITDFKYYNHLLDVKVSFSLRYYAVLAFILALGTAGVFAAQNSAELSQRVDATITRSSNVFPEDLEIKVDNGIVSVNKPEPYVIPTPDDVTDEDFHKNLIIFDSKGTINDLKDKDTFVLVNSKNVLVDNARGIEVYPTSDIPNTTVNREEFSKFINQFRVIAQYIPAIAAGGVFLAMMLYYFGFRLLYIFWMGFVLWVFGKVMGKELPYSKYYQFGVHSITVPMLVEFGLNAFEVSIGFPMWFFILHMVIGFVVLSKLTVTKFNGNKQDK